jgi:hypothetical protein
MSDPRILGPSGLTGRYYFSRDYVDHGGGHVVTRTKYDVTADVEAIIAACRAEALDDAEKVFDQMWADPGWDGQVSMGFAATFAQEMDRLRGAGQEVGDD